MIKDYLLHIWFIARFWLNLPRDDCLPMENFILLQHENN
jgi:hypothetical protein